MKRLKSMVLVLACLCVSYFSQAQSKIGIRAGVLITKQQYEQGNLDVNPESKFGADIALVADIGLDADSVVFFSPELHWMQKGAKIEDIDGTFEEATNTFNYLELPLLLKFKFGGEAGLFLFGGPSLGYLLSATDKDGDGNTDDIDLEDYKRTEIGAHLGAGIMLGPVNIDVRYILGFSNIADLEDDDDLTIKNKGFGAGVSIMF
jgi:hypothetical protein